EIASKVNEELRLQYRYLDLRRPEMARNIRLRSKVATATRVFLEEQGFLEVETPILFKRSEERRVGKDVSSRLEFRRVLFRSGRRWRETFACAARSLRQRECSWRNKGSSKWRHRSCSSPLPKARANFLFRTG